MSFDSKKEIVKFLGENGVFNLQGREKIIRTCRLVSCIPWGEGRTLEEVLVTKKVGTCTGKHLVLQACLDEIGIRYRPVVCTFRWGDQCIKYTPSLRAILKKGEWEHGHNFVQIEREDGIYLDVDITWNPKLKPYGFRTFPEDWNGKTPFVGVEKIVRRWDCADIASMKKELTEYLPPDVRERREHFLREFISWVDSINKSRKIT